MNKIPMLEKFAAQSLVEHDGELIFSKEKFAELIVRECCSVAIEQKKLAQQPTFNYQDATWDRARIQQSDLIIHKIKQHFGVEE